MKFRATAAVAAISAVALTGCGSAVDSTVQAVDPWQDSLREMLGEEFADMSNAEIGEACLELSILGLDTPAQVGSVILAFDEEGEMPPVNLTMDEFAAQTGKGLALNVPGDLTVREVVNETGAYILDMCGTDY